MPKGDNLNGVWWIAVSSVIQVVTHPVQVYAADIPHPNVAYGRSDVRLSGDELNGVFEIFSESFGCLRAIISPPNARVVDMPIRAPSELDW